MVEVTDPPIEKLRARLIERTGYSPVGRGDWRCPAHDDSTASLSVSEGADGRVLVHCHAGCQLDAVIGALDLTQADLFPSNINGHNRDPDEWTPRGPAVAVYDYVDEDGAPLFQVLRTADKEFPQRRRDPSKRGGWAWKLDDTRRVLYRLPRVIEAVAAGQPVFIVEGEKDVRSIEAQGAIATCNPGGAGKWADSYTQFLRGADVIICADRDKPGRNHARQVAASLQGLARQVRVVEPAEGKDVTDHLNSGHTLEELVQWADVEVVTPEVLKPFTRIPINLRQPVPPVQFVHPWLYAGRLVTLQSEPGVGKSWLALELCLAVMRAGLPVAYIDEEGGPELVHERLAALGAEPDLVDQHFHYYAFEARTWGDEDLQALDALIAGIPDLALAVLDSLPDFLAAAKLSEDSATDVTTFIAKVCARFRKAGVAQLLLDHLAKPQAEHKGKKSRYSRGSGAKLAKADCTILIEAIEEFDAEHNGRLRLWKTKDRRGRVALPTLGKDGHDLLVEIGDHHVTFRRPEDAPELPQWDGPTHCMEAIEQLLQRFPGVEMSLNQLTKTLRETGKSYSDRTISAGAKRLAMDGRLHMRTGPNRSFIFLYNPDPTLEENP